MVETIFLDTDVVLDKVLARESWVAEAEPLWKVIEESRVVAFCAAITPINVAYIARKTVGRSALLPLLEE